MDATKSSCYIPYESSKATWFIPISNLLIFFLTKLSSFPCKVVVLFLHCVFQILMTGCRVICPKNILVSKSCDLAIIDLLDSLLAEIS